MGSVLRDYYCGSGVEIVLLSRAPGTSMPSCRTVQWDARRRGPWVRELEGAQAVINLTGQSVNCRYNPANRERILESRTASTRVIGEAISECRRPPTVWMNASTATIYRHTFGPAWDESGACGFTPEANDQFSVEVATAWEAAVDACTTPDTRKVKMRMAMVLGWGANSVFPMLRRLVRFGLGGKMGDGRQFVSWIHHADLCRSIDFVLNQPDLHGVVNIASPNPLTNANMMAEIRKAVGMPVGFSHPNWMLELGAWALGTETELILKSRNVVPGKLLEAGFGFRFSHLSEAIADLLQRERA